MGLRLYISFENDFQEFEEKLPKNKLLKNAWNFLCKKRVECCGF